MYKISLYLSLDRILPCRGRPVLRFSRLSRDHTPARLLSVKNKNVQFVVSRCRMVKRFSEEAGSGADPEIPTPRRVKLVEGYLSRAPGHQDARKRHAP